MFDGFRKDIFIFFWCKLKMIVQWMFLQYQWNEPTEATISFKLQSTEHVLIAMRWRILWKPCTIGILEFYHIQYGSWRNTCMITWKFLWSTIPPVMFHWCQAQIGHSLICLQWNIADSIGSLWYKQGHVLLLRPQFPKTSNKV